MAGPSWVVDGTRIATKIKSASQAYNPEVVDWKSNPTKTCPRCNHIIDNSDVSQQWPGLPRGVKFDPSDAELLSHLLAKVGKEDAKPHPFIDEFIPTLEGDDGICYSHPKKLPGVKQDGNVSHFFHRTFKAYSTGNRKRRKIHNDDLGDVRWHKTGKTKPVIIDGTRQGSKKILVLYVSKAKGGKPEKTNWVMHQYHLGIGEDEAEGEYVVSKVFYQQQVKQIDKNEQEPMLETMSPDREDEVTVGPKSATPEPPVEKRHRTCDSEHTHSTVTENQESTVGKKDVNNVDNGGNLHEQDHQSSEDPKWWEGESQFLLDSQQLAEGIALCEEFLQSQSSCGYAEPEPSKPRLSDYVHLGVESLKKDLEECQKLTDPERPDVYLDTPPDMRLSQLEFGSQDSFLAFGDTKMAE